MMDKLERLVEEFRRIFALPEQVEFFFGAKFTLAKQFGSCAFGTADDIIDIHLADRTRFADMVLVACHEIVHAHDVLDGRLTAEMVDGKVAYFFDGEVYDRDMIAYHELPWEVRAYQKQKEYFFNFCRECDLDVLNWIQESIE